MGQKHKAMIPRRGEDRSDLSLGHKRGPGLMRIQWARAKQLLAAWWGSDKGCGTRNKKEQAQGDAWQE